jgi:hypothetical protein
MKALLKHPRVVEIICALPFLFLMAILCRGILIHRQKVESGEIIVLVPDHGVYQGKEVQIDKTRKTITMGRTDVHELYERPDGVIRHKREILSPEDGFIFAMQREANLQEIIFYREYFPQNNEVKP